MEKYKQSKCNPVTIMHSRVEETPFVASFPHSSTYIPDELKSLYIDAHLGRLRNTDWHLPELYDFLPALGVTSVVANFSRYVIDVNRGLDQRSGGKTYRDSLVYTKDTFGEPILRGDDADLNVDFRINHFYKPFHKALEKVLQEKTKLFGYAVLIDCHSFAVDTDADICLGAGRRDDNGKHLKGVLQRGFATNGFSMATVPHFPGGYIVRHYGAASNVEACMIELKYKTYMHPRSEDGDHIPSYDPLRASLTKDRLKKALTHVVNAFDYSATRAKGRRLTL